MPSTSVLLCAGSTLSCSAQSLYSSDPGGRSCSRAVADQGQVQWVGSWWGVLGLAASSAQRSALPCRGAPTPRPAWPAGGAPAHRLEPGVVCAVVCSACRRASPSPPPTQVWDS